MTDLPAAAILAIPLTTPERLFSGDPDAAKAQYRKLAARWQPRRDGDDSSVIAHVNALYDAAAAKRSAGTWEGSGTLSLVTKDGATYSMPYHAARPFELGRAYIGQGLVAYHVDGNADLIQRATTLFRHFQFADTRMKNEADRYLPHQQDYLSLKDGSRLIVIQKPSDLICARDLLQHLGGAIDPKHVAWMVSFLHAVACYLQYAGITHNAITLDTVFIHPSDHSGAILGGWWYSARLSDRLLALPAATLPLLPAENRKTKEPTHRVDLTSIRRFGLALLGDASGTGSALLARKDIPAPMLAFLRSPSTVDAIADYSRWTEVLRQSFGARRFVKLEVSASDIYR